MMNFDDLIVDNTYNNEPPSLVDLPISIISFFLPLILLPKSWWEGKCMQK